MYKKLANRIATVLTNNREMDRIAKLKLLYGLEVLLSNIVSMMIIVTFAMVFNCLKEFVVVFLAFKSCRKYAHGVHAKNHVNCLMSSTIFLVFVPVLSRYWVLQNWTIALFGSFFIIMFALYAPGDTEKNPILGPKIRERLRRQAVLCATLLIVIAIAVPIYWIKFCILYGIAMECISILPVTYKLLNKRRNNYGKYEEANGTY